MKHKFTMKELEALSDKQIILILINERVNGLNRYTPLAQRLQKIRNKL